LDRLGRGEEALTPIKRALEGDPLNLTFNTNLAGAYSNVRQYDLALVQFKKTIEIDPNYASAHENLARVYREIGKYDLWLEEWKKAATLANDREGASHRGRSGPRLCEGRPPSGYEPDRRASQEISSTPVCRINWR
jgi:Tfp pilus assembly protein PilF